MYRTPRVSLAPLRHTEPVRRSAVSGRDAQVVGVVAPGCASSSLVRRVTATATLTAFLCSKISEGTLWKPALYSALYYQMQEL